MAEPKLWVFFYGSYMNFDVLKGVDLVPEQWEVFGHKALEQLSLLKRRT